MAASSTTEPTLRSLDAATHPHLVALGGAFRRDHRFAAGAVDRGAATFGAAWADDFEEVVRALFPTAEAVAAAAKGYAAFALHSMRLQAAFEVELVYRCTSFEEAAAQVYLHEQHMMEEYLPGLLLSHYLWPHHYRQLQFFEHAFLGPMQVAGGGSFVEVGIGTGLYSGLVLRRVPGSTGLGIDISPSSERFTRHHLDALGVGDRYATELRDATERPTEPLTDWLVCVEVLEHLEDPVAFLRGLRASLAPGGRAFITAAVDAAHADHIHLYRTGDEVLAHLREAGFTLEQSFLGAAYAPRTTGAPVPVAAAFVVY